MEDRNRKNLLIKNLLDVNAGIDVKDDAAMDLSRYNDEKVLSALFQAGSKIEEDSMVLDSCGESIAKILVRKNDFRKNELKKLPEDARIAAERVLHYYKPEWKLD